MKSILWSLLAVAAGTLTAFLLVIGVELFSAVVHPFPPGFQNTTQEMCQHVANYPAWVLAVVVPMWGVTTLTGVWISGWLGNLYSALIVGVFLLAMVCLNLLMLPYPVWFEVGNLVVIPAAIAVGVRMSSKGIVQQSSSL